MNTSINCAHFSPPHILIFFSPQSVVFYISAKLYAQCVCAIVDNVELEYISTEETSNY